MQDSSAATGNGTAQAIERCVVSTADGLLDHFDAQPVQLRQQLLEQRTRPALVGIDDDAGGRVHLPHDAHETDVAFGVDLEFEQRIVPRLLRLAPHLGLVAEADREGRGHRLRRGQSGELPGGTAGFLRSQVPQRAIDGVARATGRQEVEQFRARQPVVQRATHGFDLRRHRRGRLAVVIDAGGLGPSAVSAGTGQPHDEHRHVRVRIARRDERLDQFPAFDFGRDLDHPASNASAMASTPPRSGSQTGSCSSRSSCAR